MTNRGLHDFCEVFKKNKPCGDSSFPFMFLRWGNPGLQVLEKISSLLLLQFWMGQYYALPSISKVPFKSETEIIYLYLNIINHLVSLNPFDALSLQGSAHSKSEKSKG